MNYTKPQELDYEDKPEDWLNSALIFASALSNLLKETEGVVVDIKGDAKFQMDESVKKVFVYRMEHKIHIGECSEDLPEGTMIWMHISEIDKIDIN